MALKSLAQTSILQASPVTSLISGYESNYFHHLETVRLSSSAASVTFSNLAQYSDFQHLQIRVVGRTSRADVGDTIVIRFNGDSGSNYRNHFLGGAGSSVTSFASSRTSNPELYRIPGGNDTSSAFGAMIIDILDPYESKNKTVRAFGGSAATYKEVAITSALWESTQSATSITLIGGNGSFVSGSRFSLYGFKARS